MRVLVTRPQGSARRTAEKLAAMGHEPVLLPLFEPIFIAAGDLGLEQCAAIAVTSAHAVQALTENSQVDKIRKLPLFTVGDATARAARSAGFANVTSAKGAGVDLAHLIENSVPNAGRLVYLAGEPRNPSFEETLQGLAVPFDVRIVYRMEPVQYTAKDLSSVIGNDLDAVLLYSRETAERLFDVAASALDAAQTKPHFLCLSHNIASAVPSKFSGQVRVSAAATESDLFELL